MEIENYREGPQRDSDKSLATFDVSHKGSKYLDLRLMITKNGKSFISYPSRARTTRSGETEYLRLYDWGAERNKEFDALVLEALQPIIRG